MPAVIHHADEQHIEGLVLGTGEVYVVTYDRGVWDCTCPALTTCSHRFALMLVTVRPGSPR